MDGRLKTLLVHRKGSTRAFPPHHPLIPVDYQFTGASLHVSTQIFHLRTCRPTSTDWRNNGNMFLCSYWDCYCKSSVSHALHLTSLLFEGDGRDLRFYMPWSWSGSGNMIISIFILDYSYINTEQK